MRVPLPWFTRGHRAPPHMEALVHHRLRALAASAADLEGDVPESELARVERLERLAVLLRQHRRDYRWPALGLASVTVLVIVLALYQARVRETEITVETEVTELSFTLAAPQAVIRPTRLASLGVAGLSAIELPASPGGVPRVVQSADGGSIALKLRAGNGRRSGQLTLDPGELPAGTRVWLRITDRDGVFVLSLRTPEGGELVASASGTLPVQGPDVGRVTLNLATPEPFRFLLGRDVADFTLELFEPAFALNPELAVSDVRLFRVPQHFRTDAAGIPVARTRPALAAKELSTIRSGAVYFEELDGKKLALRPGQELLLKGLNSARLLRVTPTRDGIASALRGKVSGLETGPESARRSLMPNRIEWLEARHLTKLLWGGLAVWVSFIGVLLQWHARKAG